MDSMILVISFLSFLVLANGSPPFGDDSIVIVDSGPLVPAEGLQMLAAAPSGNPAIDHDTWLTGIWNFLENNSTNSSLFYA